MEDVTFTDSENITFSNLKFRAVIIRVSSINCITRSILCRTHKNIHLNRVI